MFCQLDSALQGEIYEIKIVENEIRPLNFADIVSLDDKTLHRES